MSRPVEELYEQASHLSTEDRAELAGKLLESIEDPPDQGVEEAWAEEIERRIAEYRAGLKRFLGRKFVLTCSARIGNASRVL